VLEPLELAGGVVGSLGEFCLGERLAKVRIRFAVEERLVDVPEFPAQFLVVQDDGGNWYS